jgi:hypothetical protein
VTLSGLTEGKGYWLYASSPDRYLRVYIPIPEATGGGGNGLPSGGSVGDVIVNTGSGTGDWVTPTDPTPADIGAVASDDVTDVVVLTQATYDGLTPDAGTLYVVVG